MSSLPRTNARTTHARATAIGLATAATATALLAAPAAHAWVKDEACDEPVFGYKVCVSAEEEKQPDGKVRVRNVRISSPSKAPGLRVFATQHSESFGGILYNAGWIRLGGGSSATLNVCDEWNGRDLTGRFGSQNGIQASWADTWCSTWPNADESLHTTFASGNTGDTRAFRYIDIDGKA